MSKNFTKTQIAREWDPWREYVDCHGVVDRAEFDAMSIEERVSLIEQTFPEDSAVPTVEEVLSDTAIGCGYHYFPVEGGIVQPARADLLPALEAAYDATMPDWPSLVEIG